MPRCPDSAEAFVMGEMYPIASRLANFANTYVREVSSASKQEDAEH